LGKFIAHAGKLQNKPPNMIPQESLIGDIVEATLQPYLEKNGGPLKFERVEYTPGRNNVIITYPGSGDKTVSFVGSHMDVVVASPDSWTKDPFSMTREGDKLYGRGTTDCLGHVALLTRLFIHLAKTKPKLKVNVVAVFIANEENSEVKDVGVDGLVKNGKLLHLQKGWMYWVDSADKHPCIGTGSVASWQLKASGLQGHSGLPHRAINALILGYEAATEIAARFHKDFPAHPKEKEYGYAVSSSMKITMTEHPPGSVNQIPGSATISGDIRVTPFYPMKDVIKKVEGYVKDVQANIHALPGRGPLFTNQVGEKVASFDWKWLDDPWHGIACDLTSPGFKAINQATKEVIGSSVPYSLTGSLPLVFELQEAGFDLQVSGFGLSAVYHGVDEYCQVSDMKQGYQIFNRVIQILDQSS
jgi:acetylornithine deacetylase